jgi:hypothetical protein
LDLLESSALFVFSNAPIVDRHNSSIAQLAMPVLASAASDPGNKAYWHGTGGEIDGALGPISGFDVISGPCRSASTSCRDSGKPRVPMRWVIFLLNAAWVDGVG